MIIFPCVVWLLILIARFMGPIWGPTGADRTRGAPCWPNELCYLGLLILTVQRKTKMTPLQTHWILSVTNVICKFVFHSENILLFLHARLTLIIHYGLLKVGEWLCLSLADRNQSISLVIAITLVRIKWGYSKHRNNFKYMISMKGEIHLTNPL